MRVATWNINGLRARWQFLVHWLAARQPDVVALQELKLEDEQFPRVELAAAGYQAVTHGQKAWNGVAILSREPAEVVQRGLPGEQEAGARLLTARVGELSFTSIYVPNGKRVGHPDFPKKLAWLDALAAHLAAPGGAEAVVGGDFNLCPGPLDTWDEAGNRGRIFHTPEEREGFQRLLEAGWTDLYRQRHPDGTAFSWWDYRAGAFHKNQGLRIDLLLGSPAVVNRLRDVEIDRDYRKKKEGLIPSDHAPVITHLA
jgi:exodeoxyribonuclease-3